MFLFVETKSILFRCWCAFPSASTEPTSSLRSRRTTWCPRSSLPTRRQQCSTLQPQELNFRGSNFDFSYFILISFIFPSEFVKLFLLGQVKLIYFIYLLLTTFNSPTPPTSLRFHTPESFYICKLLQFFLLYFSILVCHNCSHSYSVVHNL